MFSHINTFFSTKHDLLAIGLFLGASIALMLSEAFNWFMANQVTKVIPIHSFWFAAISVLVLMLKLVCISFVLFDIDWLYERFVRKPNRNRVAEAERVRQESKPSIALEETTTVATPKVSNGNISELYTSTQTENVLSTLQSSEFNALSLEEQTEANKSMSPKMQNFLAEYLQGLEGSEANVLEEQPHIEHQSIAKYQKKDELLRLLDKLFENDKTDISIQDNSTELRPDKVRSILAKN